MANVTKITLVENLIHVHVRAQKNDLRRNGPRAIRNFRFKRSIKRVIPLMNVTPRKLEENN